MTRSKSKKIADPAAYFADWYYKIDKHHFESLGVTLREFVKNKVPYSSYAIQSPPEYQLLQGYLFYKASNSNSFFQIAAEFDSFKVEVHCGEVGKPESLALGYAVSITDCAAWLRTGDLPVAHQVIDFASSKAGLLAWQLVDKTPAPLADLSDAAISITENYAENTPFK